MTVREIIKDITKRINTLTDNTWMGRFINKVDDKYKFDNNTNEMIDTIFFESRHNPGDFSIDQFRTMVCKDLRGIIEEYISDCEVITEDRNILSVNSDELKDIENITHITVFKDITIDNKVNLKKLVAIEGNVKCVGDMSKMFYESKFNGDISKWDVSKVTDMSEMFYGSDFNGDISKWDVSNVTDMDLLFTRSAFNGDISDWVVSNVTNMYQTFAKSEFNRDISKWDVSNVTDMSEMFYYSKFNGDISKWDVSNVNDMYRLFARSDFNGDISDWKISYSTNIREMFYESAFNGDISKWGIYNVY